MNKSIVQVVALALATLLFSADFSVALDHWGIIESDETWLAVDNPHVVTNHLVVSAGITLTLEAGVEVYSDDNVRLDIFGNLAAVGAPGQEILFTRNTTSNWNYIRFLSGGGGTLEYCTVEYSNNGIHAAGIGIISASNVLLQDNNYAIYSVGISTLTITSCQLLNNTYGAYAIGGSIDLASSTFTGNTTYGFIGNSVAPGLLDAGVVFTDNGTAFRVTNVPDLSLTTPMTVTGSTTAGIQLEDCDAPTIDNQVLTGNNGMYGALRLDDCGEFVLGAGNTIGGTGLENSWPLSIGTGSFPSAATVVPTTGNTNNDIQVNGGSSIRVGTWRKFVGLDYIVSGNTTILSSGGLTLEPGVALFLDEDRRVDVFGSFTAVGAPGQEILITKGGDASWNYLRFLSEGQGTFDYCSIENAYDGIRASGSGTIAVSNTIMRDNGYAINSDGTSNLSISNSQLQDNTVGLFASGGTIDLASTIISGNTTYGYYGVDVAPNLVDTNIEFAGNATGFRLDYIFGLDLAVPMVVSGSSVAGIHLAFCDDPTLDNLTLIGNSGDQGALFFENCGEFTLGAGNIIGGPGQENSWPVTIDTGSFPDSTGIIPATGNTNNAILVVDSPSPRTATWPNFAGVNYVITDDLIIPPGIELTLAEGVSLHFENHRGMEIHGTLSADGILGQEILFTQNADSNWSGLGFQGDGTGSFAHGTIEYADAGILAAGSGIITASSVNLQNNTYGILSEGTSALTVNTCQLQNNSHGIFATGGTIDLGFTTFTDNTDFGFYGQNVAANLVDGKVMFTGGGTGYRVDGVAGLSLTTLMTITGSTYAGIHLMDCEAPTIDNLLLTGNTGPAGALYLDNCGKFTLGPNNTIGGTGLENSWPLTIGAGSFPNALAMIPTVGNTNNDIKVAGGMSDRVGTWRKFPDLDYIVTDNLTVLDGGALTLEPGLNIQFGPALGMEVYGTLTAVGVLEEEILFTQSTVESWNHLRFLADGSGSFDHCIIEESVNGIHAGGSGSLAVSHTTLRNNTNGIYAIDTAPLAVVDCLFQDNSYGIHATGGTIDLGSTTFIGNTSCGFFGYSVAPNLLDAGIVFTDNFWGVSLENIPDLNLVTTMTVTGGLAGGISLKGCDEPTIDNQILTDNTGPGGAIRLVDCGEFILGVDNIIGGTDLENSWPVSLNTGSFPSAAGVIPTVGNTNNDIKVGYGLSATTGTWRKFTDLDYVITDAVLVGGGLTLEPGVRLRFDPDTSLEILGTLSAIGAEDQEILFTANTPGTWGFLRFLAGGDGTLDYCTIEHADKGIQASGSGAIFLSNFILQDNFFGIDASGSGTISATNGILVNNNYGIHATGTTDFSVSDCLLENNAYGVRASGGTIAFLRDRIINNTSYGIYLDGAAPTFGASLAEWNDIHGNGTGQPGRELRNGLTDIEARFVYWGSLDHGEILTRIWDRHDDLDLGYVQILAFLNAAHDGQISGVEDPVHEQNLPVAFNLAQNAPNPFNPSTIIRFDLAGASSVNLKVYDVSGSLVASLVDDQLPAGNHQAVWHGRDQQGRAVPSGMYIYRIVAGRNVETRQMMLVK